MMLLPSVVGVEGVFHVQSLPGYAFLPIREEGTPRYATTTVERFRARLAAVLKTGWYRPVTLYDGFTTLLDHRDKLARAGCRTLYGTYGKDAWLIDNVGSEDVRIKIQPHGQPIHTPSWLPTEAICRYCFLRHEGNVISLYMPDGWFVLAESGRYSHVGQPLIDATSVDAPQHCAVITALTVEMSPAALRADLAEAGFHTTTLAAERFRDFLGVGTGRCVEQFAGFERLVGPLAGIVNVAEGTQAWRLLRRRLGDDMVIEALDESEVHVFPTPTPACYIVPVIGPSS